jgi:hypothetical protein
MSNLTSIPKRAIVSIQPDPMGPFEFMDVEEAKEMLNARHVGGIKRKTVRNKRKGGASALLISNMCSSSPGSCGNKLRGGKNSRTKRSRNKHK